MVNPFASLRPYIVAAARLVPTKSLDILLSAFAGLDDRFRRRRLIILGEGSCEDALRAQATSLGLGERVVFAGAVDRKTVLATMADADFLASGATTEGIPTVVLEAMMIGCPVVANNIAEVADVVRSGDAGILVERGSVASLTIGLEAILATPHLRGRRTRNAMRWVREHFSVASMVQRYESAYRRCTSEPRMRPQGEHVD